MATYSSTPNASGPVSSYDCGLATAPVTTVLKLCLTASSAAMFSALATIVSDGASVAGHAIAQAEELERIRVEMVRADVTDLSATEAADLMATLAS